MLLGIVTTVSRYKFLVKFCYFSLKFNRAKVSISNHFPLSTHQHSDASRSPKWVVWNDFPVSRSSTEPDHISHLSSVATSTGLSRTVTGRRCVHLLLQRTWNRFRRPVFTLTREPFGVRLTRLKQRTSWRADEDRWIWPQSLIDILAGCSYVLVKWETLAQISVGILMRTQSFGGL